MHNKSLLDGHLPGHYITAWSPAADPVLTVSEGDTVVVRVPEASTDQIKQSSTSATLKRIDSTKTDAAVGPIYIEDASPGDLLRVDIVDIRCAPWGWSAIFPGFGLLSDEFTRARLFHWTIRNGFARPKGNSFLSGLSLRTRPFLGVIGVAPATRSRRYTMIPPQYFGGNMDNNRIGIGSSVYFRVNVEGARLCIADTHAVQGDGEVCGTAVETPSVTTLRIKVYSNTLKTEAPTVIYKERARNRRCISTSGISPDLYEAARMAVESMIQLLNRKGLEKEEAYLLCSVAGDLRISEIVDKPNWNVGMSMDLAILKQLGIGF